MLQVRSPRSRIPLPPQRSGQSRTPRDTGRGTGRNPGRRTWRLGTRTFGPADLITLARAVLTVLVAVLIGLVMAGGLPAGQLGEGTRGWPVGLIVALSAVALVLDNVDGRVARRTGTASEFGARFDQEVDAALILVLSGYVAWDLGARWVVATGLMHYALAAGRRVLPWLRGQAPPRYWCKVVAAVQGIVLTVAAAGVLPDGVTRVALAVALVLLAESFGREVWELWRASRGPGHPRSGAVRAVQAVGAVALVWLALSLPDRAPDLEWSVLARIPLELLAVLALGLLVPRRATRVRRVAGAGLGVVLALGVLLKSLDLGFGKAFARPFDPLADWGYLASATDLLRDAVGGPAAVIAPACVGVAIVAVMVLVPAATVRTVGLAAAHRRASVLVSVALIAAWLGVAGSGAGSPGAPGNGAGRGFDVRSVAAVSTLRAAAGEISRVRDGLRDRPVFAAELAADRFAGVPADRLLNGLRGKHVLLVFVESYGRVALEDPQLAPGVAATLDRGTASLRAAGFEARSGWLTSPTFGGASWLAHATLQSGLWVNGQRRYDQLLRSDRLTLIGAFGKAGWRTVLQAPANERPWPEGQRFYRADQVYGARDVGYAGPDFGYATMPDQFTLAALHRLELSKRWGQSGKRPVMAEVDLVSSHYPWAPLPRMVPWSEVGDGSVFRGMPDTGPSSDDVIGDAVALRRGYGAAISYSLDALISYVTEHPDPDLVLVVLGDHQPIADVSRPASDPANSAAAHREVPVSIIAHDPAVLRRVEPWGWHPGLRPPISSPATPGPESSAWRMDTFRDRFLASFTDH